MKPILFNTEMVRAILAGRKTATRRVIKPQPDEHLTTGESALELLAVVCGPYHPGDILYVRETWAKVGDKAYGYKADDIWSVPRWRPSIHMPREAARIFLRVTDVRVERLQDITDEQALAEGVPEDDDYPLENPVYCPKCKGEGILGAVHPVSLGYMDIDCPYCNTPPKRFSNLWDSTLKPTDCALYGWDANPWVWVIEFERIKKEDIPCE